MTQQPHTSPASSASSDPSCCILSAANAEYIAHLYSEYLINPHNVDESWRRFFDDLGEDEAAILQELRGASWTPRENRKSAHAFSHHALGAGISGETSVMLESQGSGKGVAQAPSEEIIRKAAKDSIRALMLIRAYRARGHLLADLDPLDLQDKTYHPELDPNHYGFSASDYDRPLFIDGVLGMETATLRDIVSALKEIYCDRIGVEFMHLSDPEEKSWIQRRIESPRNHTDFTVNGKRAILQRLTAAEAFERFLHKKYPGTKRFGIDGGESLIPAIEQIIKRGGQLGLEEMVIGMSHRGRLNVLANVMGKSFTAIFSEFQGRTAGQAEDGDFLGSGDVKYHLGTSSDREFDGNTIHLSLTANPSHLEAVNPVVIGKVRAKQVLRRDYKAEHVMPLLLHGDAAFAGQGLAAETLMISELPGYRVGGTIHIVVNNQIGFTTTPKHGRSGPYPTDIAKMLSAPIFHVNGDDPEAVVHVTRIATEFRQTFKKDVVIDIFCYRRYGHNEGDEPAFTQPLMYKKIADQETTRDQYAQRLIAEGTISKAEAKEMYDEFHAYLEQAYAETTDYTPEGADTLGGVWEGFREAHGGKRRGKTALNEDSACAVGRILTSWPEDFAINSKLKRVIEARREMFKTGENFDWATAEALAFGSLLREGFPVRLSGQDCGRGTFSQRHAIFYDQDNGQKYIPLQHIENMESGRETKCEVHDSPLSEAAVLGFEYGYSLADPNTLVLWEAQFGDFVNSAQVLIDQFIASGEAKWLRHSGLVLLLPHGYEGQGPEHSSARPERFLQLSAEDNWQVCNCTTPANYFHVLRRQIHRDFRKPLILMTPKSLLRHKLAVSRLDEMTAGTTFHRVLLDHDDADLGAAQDIRRVVLCTGKVYYDLLEERRKRKLNDVRILRLEQLYPFPGDTLAEELSKHPQAEIVWCQEEPENQGAWTFVDRRIETVLREIGYQGRWPHYAGRPAAAAPATGIFSRHLQRQAHLIDEALGLVKK